MSDQQVKVPRLSEQQEWAKNSAADWFRRRREDKTVSQVFRLFGFAGTGKTTIARTIVEEVTRELGRSNVIYCAYTGKAASVLRAKGCSPSSTIHGLIYRPAGEDEKGELQFTLSGRNLSQRGPDLVILDECSMVGKKVGEDLLRFGYPVLVLGDPGQLPPIGDGGLFTEQTPDAMLTEVHRQAEDSGILNLATAVRMGESIPRGFYAESRVISLLESVKLDMLGDFDQVLCGTHKTRHRLNRKMRASLGFFDSLPQVGDKLICTRNNHALHIMNGETMTVVSVVEPGNGNPDEPGDMVLELAIDDRKFVATVPENVFVGSDQKVETYGRGLLELDFGYAITVHKSQGSQWNKVLLFDESAFFREASRKWLYTGITRAAQSITVVR